jgi:hypothetical protein
MPNLSSSPWMRGAPRGRLVTRNLVLAAEFIPQGRVADQHDVVVAAARDPRVLPRAASELEGAAELRQFRVFQDVLGKDLGSVGLCECVKSELLAAIATVAFKSLSASEVLSNPFRLYVYAFDWASNRVAGRAL